MKKLLFILIVCCSINGFSKTRYIDLNKEIDSAKFVGELVFIGYDSILVEGNPHRRPKLVDSVYNIHYAFFINISNGDTFKYKPMDSWHNENYYKVRPEKFTKMLASNGYWPKFGDTCLVVINKQERISLFAKLEKGVYTFWDPYFNTSWTSFMSYDGPFECIQSSELLMKSAKRRADRNNRENCCPFHVVIEKSLFWKEVIKK